MDTAIALPLTKDKFKDFANDISTDGTGKAIFNNSGGNIIIAMISGDFKVLTKNENKPDGTTASDFDMVSITGDVNGRKVEIFYVDGFDLDPKQPKSGSVKQGDNMFLGDATEKLQILVKVDGKPSTLKDISSLAPVAFIEDIKSAKADGSKLDNELTTGSDESKDSGPGLFSMLLLGYGAWWAYKKAKR